MTQAHQARESDRDPRRANGITASGTICRINRSDTWPHQPATRSNCSSLPTEGRPHMGQTDTRFRPAAFAWYSKASASLTASSNGRPLSAATPAEKVIAPIGLSVARRRTSRSLRSKRALSTIMAASFGGRPFSKMMNSSPPQRATRCGWQLFASEDATSFRTRSPTTWPYRSLIDLKRSMSQMTSDESARAGKARTSTSTPRRLWRPVKASRAASPFAVSTSRRNASICRDAEARAASDSRDRSTMDRTIAVMSALSSSAVRPLLSSRLNFPVIAVAPAAISDSWRV
jgi:hypothetical protein